MLQFWEYQTQSNSKHLSPWQEWSKRGMMSIHGRIKSLLKWIPYVAEGVFAMAVIMSSIVSSSVLAAPAMTISVTSCVNFSYLYIGDGDVNLSIVSESHGTLFSVLTNYDLMWRPALVSLPPGSSGIKFIASGRDAAVAISHVTVMDGECPPGGNNGFPALRTFDLAMHQ